MSIETGGSIEGKVLAEKDPEEIKPTRQELKNLEKVGADLEKRWNRVPDAAEVIKEPENQPESKPRNNLGDNRIWSTIRGKERAEIFENLRDKELKDIDHGFGKAKSYHHLIEMIRDQGTITSYDQAGKPIQTLPAETVVNLIFKLTYQNKRDYKPTDWTNITKRNNLRATVARLIDQYKTTTEYRSLAGLDLSSINDEVEFFETIKQRGKFVNSAGDSMDGKTIFSHITEGRLDLLPDPISHKIIEFRRQESLQNVEAQPVVPAEPKKGLLSRVGSRFKRLNPFGRKK